MTTAKPVQGMLWAMPLTHFPATCRLSGPVLERCNHITIGVGEYTPCWQAANGTSFTARIVADAWSDEIGVQAYMAVLPEGIMALTRPSQQQQELGPLRPHLTLFTRHGVSAFASNAMLAGVHQRAPAPLAELPMRLVFLTNREVEAKENHQSFRMS